VTRLPPWTALRALIDDKFGEANSDGVFRAQALGIDMSIQVFGMPVSRGVAIGRAVLVASSRVDVAHYFVSCRAGRAEVERLRAARNEVTRRTVDA
jgi:hypothetical protein